MIFSSKPSGILYLRRQDAVLITKGASVRLDIAPEFVSNLEVTDPAKLSELVAGFLENHKIRGQQVLLVLDNGLIFHKTVAASDHAAVKDFESKVPFDPDNKQFIHVTQKNDLTIFGGNKTLFQAVVQGIQRSNKVKAVVPAAIYGVHESKKIDKQVIATFFHDAKSPRQANFLNTK